MPRPKTELMLAVLMTLGAVANLSNFASAGTKFIPLHSFVGGSNGFAPAGALASDAAGNLYGTTLDGGNTINCGGGCGIVFQLSPLKSGGWKFSIIYSFTGDDDGSYPAGGVTVDAAGNLYGTTANGGTGCGAVYELTPNGTAWSETTLHDFANEPDGCGPAWGVTLDSSGNVYGTTAGGGPNNGGTVFQLVPQANGTWVENVIHGFASGRDGYVTYSGIIMDTFGNLYGTTGGGIYNAGTVYELSPSNNTWVEKILYYFPGGENGSQPYGGVALDSIGNLYGTTQYGGTNNVGTVYELSPSSVFWKMKALHEFSGGNDGGYPPSGVIVGTNGYLYGMTLYGGYYEWGTIFSLATSGNGRWKEDVLHNFAEKFDGSTPQSGLVFDTLGNLYGATQNGGAEGDGLIFELTP
jgi:uncharacterized repeat protein (TIGR03803 family)